MEVCLFVSGLTPSTLKEYREQCCRGRTAQLAAIDSLQREGNHPPPPTVHMAANAHETGGGDHAGANKAARVERLEAQADARNAGLSGSCRSGRYKPTRKIRKKCYNCEEEGHFARNLGLHQKADRALVQGSPDIWCLHIPPNMSDFPQRLQKFTEALKGLVQNYPKVSVWDHRRLRMVASGAWVRHTNDPGKEIMLGEADCPGNELIIDGPMPKLHPTKYRSHGCPGRRAWRYVAPLPSLNQGYRHKKEGFWDFVPSSGDEPAFVDNSEHIFGNFEEQTLAIKTCHLENAIALHYRLSSLKVSFRNYSA
ncbi:hypothetical protein Bbelb_064970 [Branchiostoma belcheri]|nr:hypothetical protein Bbelb_064970 [Branchiostoma belcheri]